jgi:hypothetical protein
MPNRLQSRKLRCPTAAAQASEAVCGGANHPFVTSDSGIKSRNCSRKLAPESIDVLHELPHAAVKRHRFFRYLGAVLGLLVLLPCD